MRIQGVKIDSKFMITVLTGIIIGAAVGFIISIWRDNPQAVFICAAGTGVYTFLVLIRKQKAASDG